MEEKTRLWDKTGEDLTVGDTIKVVAVTTLIASAAALTPLMVIGIVEALRQRRAEKRQKNQEKTKK